MEPLCPLSSLAPSCCLPLTPFQREKKTDFVTNGCRMLGKGSRQLTAAPSGLLSALPLWPPAGLSLGFGLGELTGNEEVAVSPPASLPTLRPLASALGLGQRTVIWD